MLVIKVNKDKTVNKERYPDSHVYELLIISNC